MTEKAQYESLLKAMKNAVTELYSAKTEMENLISKLDQGLSIDNVCYKNKNINSDIDIVESHINTLNNSIIPAIERELDRIDEEEKAAEAETSKK